MLSLKKIGQKNLWLFAFPILLLAVIVVFFKFFAPESMIESKAQYVEVVRPHLASLIKNPSSQNIKQTTEFLYNIKSSDRSIGDYHLPLYMAFSLWTKYTESRDLTDVTKAIGILEELKVNIPDLEQELEGIIEILQNNV